MYSPTQQRLTLADDISSDDEPDRIILTLPDRPIDGYSEMSPVKKTRTVSFKAPRDRVKKQKLSSSANSTSQSRSSNFRGPLWHESSASSEPAAAPVHEEANDDCEESQENAEYECYLHLALSGAVGIVQLSSTAFVVQGWDSRAWGGTDRWFHLKKRLIGDELAITCYCPHKGLFPCFHSTFVRHHEKELSEMLCHYEATVPLELPEKACVIFSRQPLGGGVYVNYISVGSPGHRTVKSRVVVRHEGPGVRGTWKCLKDGTDPNCVHISRAKKYLGELGVEKEEIIRIGENNWIEHVGEEKEGSENHYSIPRPRTYRMESVSYLPILPPIWASLPSDLAHYAREAPLMAIPEVILLDADAGCPHEGGRADFDPSKPILERNAILYGLTSARPMRVQLQRCVKCSVGRRQILIGPETRRLGVFNFNNRAFFSHHLLDDYTSAYTGSETPFAAWIKTVSQRYEAHFSLESFVSEEVFRAAWFAYVNLQDFQQDMACLQCGPAPEDTIWDGVTLAFHEKHLLQSLHPPTQVDDQSPDHPARYIGKQEPIANKKTRNELHQFVQLAYTSSKAGGRSKGKAAANQQEPTSMESSDDDSSEYNAGNNEGKASQDGIKERFVHLLDDVRQESQELANALLAVYSGVTMSESFDVLSGDDPWFMIVNRPALQELIRFNRDHTWQNATRLVLIPCLYETLELYHNRDPETPFPKWILDLCRWMEERSQETLQQRLQACPRPQTRPLGAMWQSNWKKSGCFYSLPQIRLRPRYPTLRHDNNPEKSVKRGKCSKYFSQYGKNRLTGGIIGEGRNDVFSALYTRWPNAPKRVIYDYACALGPYAMTREPDFFGSTKFLIDLFHAGNHSNCSSAAALETYMTVDPRLSAVNSSAAECGNGGLLRIRKSVSYMTQERAIIYTKVFLSIWNRLRLRGMLRK